MKRARFLLRVIPGDADRERSLRSLKAIGANLGASIRHPRWTSYGALEVDVFAASGRDFELFVAAAEPLAEVEFTRSLDEPPRPRPEEEVVEEAVRYFNSERYWECHEELEPLWRRAKGEERSLIQGVILVCAALVHEQRGEREVALDIYRRALPQLGWRDKEYRGIDVPRLRRNVERSLERGETAPFKV